MAEKGIWEDCGNRAYSLCGSAATFAPLSESAAKPAYDEEMVAKSARTLTPLLTNGTLEDGMRDELAMGTEGTPAPAGVAGFALEVAPKAADLGASGDRGAARPSDKLSLAILSRSRAASRLVAIGRGRCTHGRATVLAQTLVNLHVTRLPRRPTHSTGARELINNSRITQVHS